MDRLFQCLSDPELVNWAFLINLERNDYELASQDF